MVVLFFFFFFQAEDGIRDTSVTGVQTCALPISRLGSAARLGGGSGKLGADLLQHAADEGRNQLGLGARGGRSEERRVGKECGSGGWGWDGEKKRGSARGASGAARRDGGKERRYW